MIKILLADDVQLYLALEKTFLARSNYEFLTATRGPDAWLLLREHRPQLSIIEANLPGLGALDLRRQQLEDPELASIPMVVTTSDADNGVRDRASDLGIAAVLVKPFNVDVLTRAVQAVLPAQRRRHVRFEAHVDVSLHIDRTYRDATTIDLSLGGLLIAVEEPLSMGQIATIQIALPGEEEPVGGRARVVRYAKERRRHGPCYGIEFVEMPEADRARLAAYLDALPRA